MPSDSEFSQTCFPDAESESFEEFLTPQQRLEVVAEILATIALRVVTQSHEEPHEYQIERQNGQ